MMKNANSMFICLLVLCRPETMFDYGIGLQTKNSIAIKEIDNDFFDN